MHGRVIARLAILYLAAGITAGLAAERPRCLLLPFRSAGVEADDATLFTERLRSTLVSAGDVGLLASGPASQRLDSMGYSESRHVDAVAAAVAAGRMVQADYVVTGEIVLDGGRYAVYAEVVVVERGLVLRRGRTPKLATVAAFVDRAPALVAAFVVDAVQRDPGVESTPAPADDVTWEWYWPDFDGRLELGTRSAWFKLLDDDSDSFVGSVTHLEAEQGLWPIKLFARWWFNRHWGLELTWDRVEAEAQPADDPDGIFSATGPLLNVIGRYPNQTRWTPYGFFGLGWMMGKFDPYAWWELGYDTPADWELYDRNPDTGIRRHMDMSDEFAIVIGGGASYSIQPNLALDLQLRYMALDLDDHYYRTSNGRVVNDWGVTTIPLDNIALGLGISYVF